MEKEYCIIYTEWIPRRILPGYWKDNQHVFITAHKKSSACKMFRELYPGKVIDAVFVEYRERRRERKDE